jgi:hypothetical protein
VHENKLTFEDIELNLAIPAFKYAPQDSVELKKVELVEIGVTDSLKAVIGGSANSYKWFKNGVEIPGNNTALVILTGVNEDDDAIYHYEATSSLVTDLTLIRNLHEYRVSSLRRDSISLHKLYTSTNGAQWTDNENWITTPIKDGNWFGVTITNDRVSGLNLPGNNLNGVVPSHLADVVNLTTVDLSNNEISSLPDLRQLTKLTSLNVSGNNLDFGSLESNVAIPGFVYNDQADLGTSSTVNVPAGESHELVLNLGGNSNRYQWMRNGTVLENDTLSTYNIESIGRSNMGRYVCEIRNSIVTDLVLRTAVDTINAVADLSGTLYAGSEIPAANGTITLLRIQNVGGYDTTRVQNVNEDGTYHLSTIILDDYQILGFVDTIEYSGALPSYYENTIFWEEADTVFVEGTMDSLDIVSTFKPTAALTGNGVIGGYVIEDDGTGSDGRSKANKRVSSAGVSVRRVERAGRTKEENLVLVAYVFTDSEGEFRFTHLPVGQYRLNIQYPGYPMDETSYTTITIGEGLESEKKVEAEVKDGKIVVRPLIITAVWEMEGYKVEVYPNPATSVINLEFLSISDSRNVELHDAKGKQLIHKKAPGKKESLDVNFLSKGHYLLNVQDKGQVVKTMHVIVE